MSEELIICHCAPTLAGMKTGNLFNCKCDSVGCLEEVIKRWNQQLNPKGVHMKLLTTMKERALIYVFRPRCLEEDMSAEEVRGFLKDQGYNEGCPQTCIQMLSEKLQECQIFPHEIGVFLGYPIKDVKSFIENNGQCYICTGLWKVYHDEEKARKTFEKYKRCTSIYKQKLREGREFDKLVVNRKWL